MKAENPTVQELLSKRACLEEFAQHAVQRMIAHAMEAEVTMFMEKHRHIRTRERKAAVVRNGYLPQLTITTSEQSKCHTADHRYRQSNLFSVHLSRNT